jgi:hypothetical protein
LALTNHLSGRDAEKSRAGECKGQKVCHFWKIALIKSSSKKRQTQDSTKKTRIARTSFAIWLVACATKNEDGM